MKLSEHEVEARLRRTFEVMADTPLDDATVMQLPARRAPRAALAVALAAAALVAGVVAVQVRPSKPVSTVADSPAGQEDLASFLLTDEESALLFRAEQRLVHDCMKAAGHRYDETDVSAGGLDPEWSRLGRTDARRADELGYATPAGPGGANAAQKELQTASQRDRWSQAYDGQPHSGGPAGDGVPLTNPVTGEQTGAQTSGGCFGQSQRTLYGDQARHTSLASWIGNEVRSAVERDAVADPRFDAGIKAWSSCMTAKGYAYTDPFGPVQEFASDATTAKSERERAVARDDVACKDAVGLVRIYQDLKAEHGRAVVAEYEQLLAEYRAIVDRALAKARTVVATP
ncbi:MAG TPA: hypothetical protein VM938_05285 [Acidimicrobiales bacterium]|nr:hypothetical protein [Acidimicrobiales bacterium]